MVCNIKSKKRPLISVILATYNCEQYLLEAITSIQKQTIDDFELIVLDDCSSDDTCLLLDKINDSRLIVIKNEKNLGLSATLNRGLEEAKGKYIARMDADDICIPERFAMQLALMEYNKKICVCSGSFTEFGKGKATIVKATDNKQLRNEILLRNPIAHPFAMFRASFFKKNGIKYNESYKYAQDYALWIRLVHEFKECGFANIPGIAGYYRVHPNSASSSKGELQQAAAIQARLPFLEDLCGKVTEKEMWIHDNFYIRRKDPVSPEDFLEKKTWLLKLKQSNDVKSIYESKYFNACLARKFYEMCMASLWLGPWVVRQLTGFPEFSDLHLPVSHLKYMEYLARKWQVKYGKSY